MEAATITPVAKPTANTCAELLALSTLAVAFLNEGFLFFELF